MLALYGAGVALRPTLPVAPERLELQTLSARRDQLVEMRKGERIRLKGVTDPVVIDSIGAMLAVLDDQIRALERRIAACVARSADLTRDAVIVRSAPGVGPVCTGVLLAALPELGRVDRRAIAALAGLAPVARDSGLLRGQRRVQGGRKRVRDALYMAAVSAVRTAPFQADYARMRANGKPPKLALIAIARKLLVALNAAIRDQRTFVRTPSLT